MRVRALVVRAGVAIAVGSFASTLAAAQPVPKPFPKPNPPQQPAPPPATPPPAQPQPSAAAPSQPGAPTEAMLGLPIYPGAEFLTSFDAGMGQRYYLFGTIAGFVEIVSYYKTVLKEKGELVFDAPATHMFEVGRFREDTMAFPPGVTVKDYTWSGSQGYLHVKGTIAKRFRTIIQLVPVPAGSIR